MDASSGGPTEHVIYWTRVGNECRPAGKHRNGQLPSKNLRGIIPDAILVRISTVSENGDAAKSSDRQFRRGHLLHQFRLTSAPYSLPEH